MKIAQRKKALGIYGNHNAGTPARFSSDSRCGFRPWVMLAPRPRPLVEGGARERVDLRVAAPRKTARPPRPSRGNRPGESGKRNGLTPETGPRWTAVVTGASSGIGREFARLAAKDGRDVVLVARRRDRLEELASELTRGFGVGAFPLPADLSEPDAPGRIFRESTEHAAEVDLLVNAAGLGVHGFFADTPLEKELETIRVNVLALTELTKLFLPGMLARRRGVIVNLASTAAFQPGPLMAVYYATKAYVLSFTEALAEELHGTGVTATALCPGPTLTEFQEKAGMEDTPLFSGSLVSDAAFVAREGYRGAMRGKRVVVPGFANRVLAYGARIGPRRLATRVARKLQEKRSRGGRPKP